MQRYTIFFITVDALHVSGCFSEHHQELKNSTHSIWYVPGLLAATASVVGLEYINDARSHERQTDDVAGSLALSRRSKCSVWINQNCKILPAAGSEGQC
jgi:hypothetical protein